MCSRKAPVSLKGLTIPTTDRLIVVEYANQTTVGHDPWSLAQSDFAVCVAFEEQKNLSYYGLI